VGVLMGVWGSGRWAVVTLTVIATRSVSRSDSKPLPTTTLRSFVSSSRSLLQLQSLFSLMFAILLLLAGNSLDATGIATWPAIRE